MEESADSFISTGDTGDHQVVVHQGRAGGAVVLMRVDHLRIQDELASEAMQREYVRVIADHEAAVAQHGDTAIDATGRVPRQALRTRPAVVPDLAAAAGIERVCFV